MHRTSSHTTAPAALAMPFALTTAAFAVTLLAQPVHAQSTASTQRNLVITPAPGATATKVQRIALVIGNSAYKEAPLANPVNDARAVAKALTESGFLVIIKENADQRTMQSAVRDFGDRLRSSGGAGLFYYAGHGMQIKGRNYLIPVGATLEREDEVAYAAMDAQAVLDKMESAGNATNIMILDACRNNPFTRGTRSAQAGLAQMDAPLGTLVAYATAPGSVASDGSGGSNGLYTEHLLKAMRQPGMKVEDVFKQVRAGVRKDSQGKQIPWESTSLEGDFFFTTPAAAPNPQDVIESALWDAVKDSRHAAEVQAYLTRYPQGKFADQAKRRLAQLGTNSAAAPLTSPSPVAAAPAPTSVKPNAAAKPATSPRFAYEVGDTWRFEKFEPLNNKRSRYTYRITEVQPNGLATLQSGTALRHLDAHGQQLRRVDEDRQRDYGPGCKLPETEPSSKKPETSDCKIDTRWSNGKTYQYEGQVRLAYAGEEKVSTPAGEFLARKYVRTVEAAKEEDYRHEETTYWYVDGLKHWIAQDWKVLNAAGQLKTHERSVLAEYSIQNPLAADAIRINMVQAASHSDGQGGVNLGDFVASAPIPSSAAVAPAPGSTPATVPKSNTFGFTVGDRWRYQVVDKFKKEVVKNYGRKITGIQSDGSLLVDDGAQRWTPQGALVLSDYNDGYRITMEGSSNVRYPSKLAAGASEPMKFTENWKEPSASGANAYDLTLKVLAEEEVTVPAGTFRSWRVEMSGNFTQLSRNTTGSFKQTCWYVPQLLAYAACDRERRLGTNLLNYDRTELTSYDVHRTQALASSR